MKDFMELGEALRLIHELAKENAISKAEARENDLLPEYQRQQTALDTVEDFIVGVCAEENGDVWSCHKCHGIVADEDSVWLDPETTLATTGDRGRPYHPGCAPAQEIVICVICAGEIEDIDQLHVMTSGQFCHKSCIEGAAIGR